jgi:hypothetical protein
MKRTLLLLLLFASVSLVVQATPCVQGGTLASYIALGSGGCTFDSLLFNNFGYTNPASGGGISPDATGIDVDLVSGTEAGLEFVGTWEASSGETSDGNIGYVVTCQNCQIDDLELIMNDGLGLGTGIASVVETAVSSNGTVGLGAASSPGFSDFSDTLDITPTGSLTMTKDIGASGGSAGVGHVSAVSNLFSTTTTTTMTPEPSLMLLCSGLLGLLLMARRKMGVYR